MLVVKAPSYPLTIPFFSLTSSFTVTKISATMPSQRRVRVVAVFAAVIICSILYFTVRPHLIFTTILYSRLRKLTLNFRQSSADQSNKDFYDRTVAAMDARQGNSRVEDVLPDLSDQEKLLKVKEAEERSALAGYQKNEQEAEALRKPPEIVTKGSPDGAVGGGKKWDTGKKDSEPKEEAETEEEMDVKAELNSILKRSPSMFPRIFRDRHLYITLGYLLEDLES